MNYYKIKMTAEAVDQEAIRSWINQMGSENIQISDGLFVASTKSAEEFNKGLAENKFSNVTLQSLSEEDLKEATPEMKRLME